MAMWPLSYGWAIPGPWVTRAAVHVDILCCVHFDCRTWTGTSNVRAKGIRLKAKFEIQYITLQKTHYINSRKNVTNCQKKESFWIILHCPEIWEIPWSCKEVQYAMIPESHSAAYWILQGEQEVLNSRVGLADIFAHNVGASKSEHELRGKLNSLKAVFHLDNIN